MSVNFCVFNARNRVDAWNDRRAGGAHHCQCTFAFVPSLVASAMSLPMRRGILVIIIEGP